MWRMAKLIPIAFIFLASPKQQQSAPEASWVKTVVTDPLRRTSFERFTLDGKFLIAPQRSSLKEPRLTIECQPGMHKFSGTMGHFLVGWFDTGAVLDSVLGEGTDRPQLESGATLLYDVSVEYRRDGEKKLQEDLWPTAQNAASAYIRQGPFCGGCTLADLLYAHDIPNADKLSPVRQLIIGMPEYRGSEIEMQFDMPDPREIGDACGLIIYSKKEWKKKLKGAQGSETEP